MNRIEPVGMLSREELEEAISAFSNADWLRLKKTAVHYAIYPVESDDLLQEALSRALGGARNCPKGISVVRFLAEAIRSIAHDELNKVENLREETSMDDETITNPEAINVTATGLNAEERIITNEQIQGSEERLLALFEDDDEAQLIVIGMLTGAEGAELREATGLDGASFNSKRRYVRRKLNDARENGFRL